MSPDTPWTAKQRLQLHQIRNFVIRLSIHYILLLLLLLLRGISRDRQLFGVWIMAFVFTALTVTVRRLLLTLTLPLIIMTGGLFVFIIDGLMLALTAALTRLNINNVWWTLLGVLVMSLANTWIERALRALGWFQDTEPGQKNVMTRHAPSLLTRLILLALLLFGVGYSAAMAGQLFLVASTLTTHISIITGVACFAFALLIAGIGWLVAEGLALPRRARFSLITAAVATLIVAAPAVVLILNSELPPPTPEPEPGPGASYWGLPTGSQIAYYDFAAVGGTERNPIIFLHDFGQAVLETDRSFLQPFSDAGFDVYLYDQVGCGRSGRLADIAAYTIDRHLDDLEAIRETIRADRLILIGYAGGAELAARYMIEHPDRVERVIFYGPTPLWDDDQFAIEESRTAASPVNNWLELDIPPVVAVAIAAYSPKTAQRYVPQAAMVTWSNEMIDSGQWVCLGQTPPRIEAPGKPTTQKPGYNRYVETVTRVSSDRGQDPRPELEDLLVPTILLRGSCDPVEETVVAQYQTALPYLMAVEFEGAGRMPHLSQATAVQEVMMEFLSEGP